MIKVLLFSMLALFGIYLAAQQLGAITPQQAEDRLLLAELNRQQGLAFLEQSARREGVVTLPDGMLVEMLAYGEGEVPEREDWVQVHYRGWHVDGRLFESSYRLGVPGEVPLPRTILGWQRLLTEIPVGSRVWVALPPELAYGVAGSGYIGPEETVIFEIELLAIATPQPTPPRTEDQRPVPGLQ